MSSPKIINESGGSSGYIGEIAALVGTTAPGLRLILSILCGYPIAALYRLFIEKQPSKTLHHFYFAACGLTLCLFNYGYDTYHSMTAVWITYLLLNLLKNAVKQLLIINFVFHMSYLLLGYYYTASSDYDILWTMPHCVLTLRLIGLTFDIADGMKPNEMLSINQKETALNRIPTLLEVTAYVYFPSSFLIGPQFPFRRYESFINGEFRNKKNFLKASLSRMALGFIYLAARQLGSTILPDSYLYTDAFRNESFFWRLVHLGIWGKISLYKYIMCWLLTEGSLIAIGLSYVNRKPNDGNKEEEEDWSGCSNVKVFLFETGYKMDHYIQSFNVNTNNWVACYIYKRLKFLNNQKISYAAALIFLALWHGFHSGYYMAFILEYLIILTEKQIESIYNSQQFLKYSQILNKSMPFKCTRYIILKFYNIVFMGFCMAPFSLLSYDRWLPVISTVNYFGFYIIAIWFVIYHTFKFYLKTCCGRKNSSTKKQTSEDQKLIDKKLE